MATYEILDDSGAVINTIIADEAFVEAAYPGHYRLVPPPAPDWISINKQTAESLLQATDWTATIDIADPQYSNPYLTNQADFLAYRSTVRAVAVNPPNTEWTPPVKPDEQWSS